MEKSAIICSVLHCLLSWTALLALVLVSTASTSKHSLRNELIQKLYRVDDANFLEKLPEKHSPDGEPMKIHLRHTITHMHGIHTDRQELDLRLWISMKRNYISISSELWTRVHWKNEQMAWNQTKYGIRYVSLNPEKIWRPKLAMPTSLSSVVVEATKGNSYAVVMSNGEVKIDISIRLKFRCKMSSCYFPKDKHICKLDMLLVGHNESDVKLVHDPASFGYFEEKGNGLWSLGRSKSEAKSLNIMRYTRDWKNSMIETSWVLERRSTHYYLTICGPVILICLVTFCAVLLPRDSSDRMALLVTCFLAQVVYLDVIFHLLPHTSDYVPLIVSFLIAVLVFTALQIFVACLIAFCVQNIEMFESAVKRIKKIFFNLRYACCRRNKTSQASQSECKTNNESCSRCTTGHVVGTTTEREEAYESSPQGDQSTDGEDVKHDALRILLRIIHIFSTTTFVVLLILSFVSFKNAFFREPSFLCDERDSTRKLDW